MAKKKKRGRPRTGQTPKQNFRMSHEEFAVVKEAAVASGEDTSKYIRRVLLASAKRVLSKK